MGHVARSRLARRHDQRRQKLDQCWRQNVAGLAIEGFSPRLRRVSPGGFEEAKVCPQTPNLLVGQRVLTHPLDVDVASDAVAGEFVETHGSAFYAYGGRATHFLAERAIWKLCHFALVT